MSTAQVRNAEVPVGPRLGRLAIPRDPNIYHTRKIVSSRNWYIAKIGLGCVAILGSIVLLGVGGAYSRSPYGWPYAVSGLVQGVLALCWQAAEFITLLCRKDRGIHPGAHVALQLIFWLAFAGGGILLSIDLDAWIGYPDLDDEKVSPLEWAMTIMDFFLCIIHGILFVRYCIECHRRNMSSWGGPYNLQAVSGQPENYLGTEQATAIQTTPSTHIISHTPLMKELEARHHPRQQPAGPEAFTNSSANATRYLGSAAHHQPAGVWDISSRQHDATLCQQPVTELAAPDNPLTNQPSFATHNALMELAPSVQLAHHTDSRVYEVSGAPVSSPIYLNRSQ